jgi:formamidopyrimidine-DNA glycosylase
MLNLYSPILALIDSKFDDPIEFKDTTAKDFATNVKGKKVVAVKRWGKYFW